MSESISLEVNGMKCGGCESNVSTQLAKVEGVSTVNASSKENTVDVTFDPSKTNLEVIKEVISKAGYVVSA